MHRNKIIREFTVDEYLKRKILKKQKKVHPKMKNYSRRFAINFTIIFLVPIILCVVLYTSWIAKDHSYVNKTPALLDGISVWLFTSIAIFIPTIISGLYSKKATMNILLSEKKETRL